LHEERVDRERLGKASAAVDAPRPEQTFVDGPAQDVALVSEATFAPLARTSRVSATLYASDGPLA